nr:MAG: capsid protein [Chemarfal virus 134]
MLPLTYTLLPGDIIRSNPSLLSAMKIASYYRADLVLNISVAGTITHSGCVLAAVLPPTPAPFNNNSHRDLINTCLSGPHAYLYANEATSVNITVPWYCNSDMATLDMELASPTYKPSVDITPINGNYATLALMVLNPLRPSQGSSTDVSIVIEACFKHLDMVVPTPRYVEWKAESLEGLVTTSKGIGKGLLDSLSSGAKKVVGDAIDTARQAIFGWTGLHNPNIATIKERLINTNRNFPNTVDSSQYFEKLDPYTEYNRIVKQPLFGTTIDEMRIRHIVSKKQMIGTFSVTTSDVVGKLLWSRPISPYQGGLDPRDPYIANNIELMHFLSRAWRGKLNLHITSVMNNKQQVKLKVIKMYNPSISAQTGNPVYKTVANAPSHLIEYTQGGQEQTITLPFLCRNDLIPCARDFNFEAIFHGMYYIYVAQPLVVSDGSPVAIEFNVFISGGDDLTFYGYSTEKAQVLGFDQFVVTPLAKTLQSSIAKNNNKRESKSIIGQKQEVPLIKHNTHVARAEGIPINQEPKVSLPRNLHKKKAENVKAQSLQSVSTVNISEIIHDWKALDSPNIPVNSKRVYKCIFQCVSESLTVMNEPQTQDDSSMKQDAVVDLNHVDRLAPNVDIRPYIRRMYRFAGYSTPVPAATSNSFTLPLSAIVGEDPVLRGDTSTPTILLSNMYYGKTVGFKFQIKTTILNTDFTFNTSAMMLNCRFVPPNMNYLQSNNTVVQSTINLGNDDANPFATSSNGFYPFNFQLTPVHVNENNKSMLYEFVIPDVTFYKFMGGPNKLATAFTLFTLLSTYDFGNLILTINNVSTKDLTVGLQVFAGLTDESRMGHHVIAPLVKVGALPDGTVQTLYGGNPNGVFQQPLAARSPYLYKGGFL